jgi:ribosomal protein L37AE/L43A
MSNCSDCKVKPRERNVIGFGSYFYCPTCGKKGKGGMASVTIGGAIAAWNRINGECR